MRKTEGHIPVCGRPQGSPLPCPQGRPPGERTPRLSMVRPLRGRHSPFTFHHSPFTILHSSFFILHFPNVRHKSVLHRGSRGNRCRAQSAYYLCMRNKMPAFPRNRFAVARIIFLDLPASAHALQAGQSLITTLFFLFTRYRSDARETPVPQPHYPLLPPVNRCFPAGSILIGHPKAYHFATCRYCFRHLSDLDSGDKQYRCRRQPY